MSYTQVDSSTGKEGALNGPLFAGDHRPDGIYSSLKGKTITPPELSFDVQDSNVGPDRLNQEVSAGSNWVSTGPVMSGTYNPQATTGGGGTMAK